MPTSIRLVEATELAKLQAFAAQTFSDTYAHLNDPKEFKRYMETAFSSKQLLAELENPRSAFYFLEQNEQVIGYIKINEDTAQTDLHEPDSLELERIYVHQSVQGQGYGKRLIQEAIFLTKVKGKTSLWLGVWNQNPKAIAFYENQGFEKFGEHSFVIGDENQVDYLMRVRI